MSIPRTVVAVTVAFAMGLPVPAAAAPGPEQSRDPAAPTSVEAPPDPQEVKAEDVSLPEATQPSVVSTSEPGEPGTVTLDPSLEPEMRRHRSLVIGGTVLIGVSVAAFVAMVAGLVVWHEADDQLRYLDAPEDADEADKKRRQRTAGKITSIAGGATAGVAMAAGIGLVVVGRRRQRELLRRSQTTLLPLRGGAGLSWRVRF